MISWMQNNNKFSIIVMWIAAGSFILSTAAVGISSGLRSNTIEKVGDITLTKDRFSMNYNQQFNAQNERMQGKFDKELAKQMHLDQTILNTMRTQAKLLNLANNFGITVSEKETASKLASFPAFQTNGQFDRKIYDTYIQYNNLSNETFESNLRDELIIEKTLKLLDIKGLEEEYNAFKVAFEIADKFKYIILSDKDVEKKADEKKLKEFWEERKEQYKTPRQYTLDIQWTETQETVVSEEDIQKYYKDNKFNYTDKEGKILPLEEVKEWLIEDVKIKKSKKIAYKRYLKLKKKELSKDETLTLDSGDTQLSPELWAEIQQIKAPNEFLKPKVVEKRYASVKVTHIIEPVIKSFEEIKKIITPLYQKNYNKEALLTLAEEKLSIIDTKETNVSTFITLNNAKMHNFGLNKQETVDFTGKLFTSEQEKGIIPIGSKVVVYKIIEQKLVSLENNETKNLYKSVDELKNISFQTNLIEELNKQYPTN